MKSKFVKRAWLAAGSLVVVGGGVLVLFTGKPKPEDAGFVMQPHGPPLPGNEFLTGRPTCMKNLGAISCAFAMWSSQHDFELPFNVSTNAGGTKEFCAIGQGQFDSNALLHFRVMTNAGELTTPVLLICPQDKLRRPAASFADLKPENVTYRLRTGTNINNHHPKEVLIVCPVDGNTLLYDGTILEGKKR